MIGPAARICADAEVFMLVGSSLAVYPAAGLIGYVNKDVPKYIIDPKIPDARVSGPVIKIQEKATVGVTALVNELLKD
jgi:NAD-dependent deacetylase